MRGGQVFLEIEPEKMRFLMVKEVAHWTEIVGLERGCQQALHELAHRSVASPAQMLEIVVREIAFIGRAVHDQEQRREGQEQGQASALGHGRNHCNGSPDARVIVKTATQSA